MNGAPFGQRRIRRGVCLGEKHWVGVDFARFVVAANAHHRPGGLHLGKRLLRKRGRVHGGVEVAQKRAANGEIKDKFGNSGEIKVNNRADFVAVGLDPVDDGYGLGAGG